VSEARVIRAKPKQTLHGHLADCLRVLKLSYPIQAWEYAFSRLGYDPVYCGELLNLITWTHDLGKATERWQNYLDTKKGRVTHALFSALILNEMVGLQVLRTPEGAAALMAVLAHHSMLHDNAYSGESIKGLGEQTVPVEDINVIWEEFEHNHALDIKPLASGIFTGTEGAKLVAALRRRVQEMRPVEKLRFKGLYTIFLSALQLCDNEASYQYQRVMEECNDSDKLLGSVVPEASGMNECLWRYVPTPGTAFSAFLKSPPGSGPNEVQRAVILQNSSYIILQAGCGSGKTAAALHFIASRANRGEVDRGIITLPTRFTTNSMFWDFQSHYGLLTGHTGIHHGEVESVLLSAREEEEETDLTLRDLKIENSFFNRPVNVCTVDHLLYSLLHCHRCADRAFGNLMTAAVVFDEIHFYDEFTLKKIGQCMQLLRSLKVPHMVMSATIPRSVVSHLQEEAACDGADYSFIRQDIICIDDEEDKPFIIEKKAEPLIDSGHVSNELESLLGEHLSLRQMVVVNQVERAKAVAREARLRWPRANVVCYHSEFSRRDRDVKERIIRALFRAERERTKGEKELLAAKGFTPGEQVLLVSTQICEMSLNISADVMYSEIAPADAVAQRGGRLHRRGRFPRAGDCSCRQCLRLPKDFQFRLYLFPLPWDNGKSHLPYKDDNGGESILQKSWEVIGGEYSFSNVVQWVNEVYPEAPSMENGAMCRMIVEDAVFGRRPSERFGDEYGDVSEGSFRVRHKNVTTATVVPAARLPEGNFDPLRLVKDEGMQVSLPKLNRWKDHWHVREVNWQGVNYKINILDVPYSEELGFEF